MKRFLSGFWLVLALGQLGAFCWLTIGQGLTFKDIAFLSSLRSHPSTPPGGGGGAVIDCSFDQAIFSQDMNQIFAIRGAYLYRLDANGGLVDQTRILSGVLGDSSIVEIGEWLYVSAWRGVIETTETGGDDQHARDIFKVNRTNLTTTALGVLPYATKDSQKILTGFQNLITDGTNIFGKSMFGALGIFTVDPSDPSTYSRSSYPKNSSFWDSFNDFSVDTDHAVIWIASPNSPALTAITTDLNFSDNNTGTIPGPIGVAYCNSTTNTYCVNGTTNLIKADAVTAYSDPPFITSFSFSTIALTNSSLAGMNPVRIKYRKNNQRLYIPTWENDQVIVFDPATDTVESIKSGFNGPFDVVFADVGTNVGKAFAVQQSSLGVKEIIP